jgi:hypothetical protein
LISATEHNIERRYQDTVCLQTAARVVITANKVTFAADAQTKEDDSALADRFLWVRVSGGAAKTHVQALSGRRLTSWVVGGGIARYALWLAKNRQITPGQRFLVQGNYHELAR